MTKLTKGKNFYLNCGLCIMLAMYICAFLMPKISEGFMIVAVILAVTGFICFDFRKSLLLVSFFVTFYGDYFRIKQIPSFVIMLCLFVFVYAIKYFIALLQRKEKLKLPQFICCVVLALYGFVRFNIKGYDNLIEHFLMVAFIYIFSVYVKQINLKEFVLYYVASVVILMGLGLICSVSSTLKPILWMEGRFQSFSGNPNSLQALCIMAIAFLISLHLKDELSLKFFLPIVLIMVLCGLLTLSKTFIICLIPAFIWYIVFKIKKDKKKGLIETSVILGGFLVIAFIFNNKVMEILQRFYSGNYSNILDSLFTGRFTLWKNYLGEWSASISNILFGCGITSNGALEISPHNTYIEYLYKCGLFGILIIIVTLSIFYNKRSKENFKFSIVEFLPLFIFLFRSLVECFLGSRYIILIIIATLFAFNKKKEVIDEKK